MDDMNDEYYYQKEVEEYQRKKALKDALREVKRNGPTSVRRALQEKGASARCRKFIRSSSCI
jgi:hypothetical protein